MDMLQIWRILCIIINTVMFLRAYILNKSEREMIFWLFCTTLLTY